MELGCDLGIRFSINVNMLVATYMMTSSCLLQWALMISSISFIVILGAANINDIHDYCHCSDGTNFVCGYCENHPHR
jgi:hypothetical protein